MIRRTETTPLTRAAVLVIAGAGIGIAFAQGTPGPTCRRPKMSVLRRAGHVDLPVGSLEPGGAGRPGWRSPGVPSGL